VTNFKSLMGRAGSSLQCAFSARELRPGLVRVAARVHGSLSRLASNPSGDDPASRSFACELNPEVRQAPP
jgi:hypothetical protein